MVFRESGKIVHVERHNRFHGDFIPQKEMQKISAASAMFAVSQGASPAKEILGLFLPRSAPIRPLTFRCRGRSACRRRAPDLKR